LFTVADRPLRLSEAPVPVLTKDNNGDRHLRYGRPRGAAPTSQNMGVIYSLPGRLHTPNHEIGIFSTTP